jgi:hypothetical protein
MVGETRFELAALFSPSRGLSLYFNDLAVKPQEKRPNKVNYLDSLCKLKYPSERDSPTILLIAAVHSRLRWAYATTSAGPVADWRLRGTDGSKATSWKKRVHHIRGIAAVLFVPFVLVYLARLGWRIRVHRFSKFRGLSLLSCRPAQPTPNGGFKHLWRAA